MSDAKRTIEIFSAGCPLCESVIARVRREASPSCNVTVIDIHTPAGRKRAQALEVVVVPAVAIDGRLADCCGNRGVDIDALRAAGLGRPIA